jgi:hypothetical protein
MSGRFNPDFLFTASLTVSILAHNWEVHAMYVQIVNFNLSNTTAADFEKLCRELAPQFAALPGLISKVWLADPASNTFGGVYMWQHVAGPRRM